MRVFLTGGTGFIGQHLTQALIRRGWEVNALVRNPNSTQAKSLANMGASCVVGDVTERESMRSGMTGCDLVIHNAAWYEVGIRKQDHERMHTINVGGTDNVLSLAQELNIPRTVYVSSTTYYGDTGSALADENFSRQVPYYFYYEQTKAEAHEVACQYQQRGLPIITICPAHVVGANDHSPYGYFLRLYVNHFMPPLAWGANTVHTPAHVKDIAEGIVLAAEKGRTGENYILAGEPTNMRQLFEMWETKPGGFRVRAFLPFWLMMLLLAPLEPVQHWLGIPAFLSRETVAAMRGSVAFSSTKAQKELGWTYRPAQELWSSIIDEEIQLLAQRKKRDLVSRLKPVE
jgi:dihydroflavonol-4-reductase